MSKSDLFFKNSLKLGK